MAGTFEVELKGGALLKDHFQRLGPLAREAQKRTVQRAGHAMEERLTRAATGEILHVRSDAYRSSIGSSEAAANATGFEVHTGIRSGAASAYAGILEDGGTIRPKNARVLSVPVGDALYATGVAKYGSPLDVPGDAFWITGKKHPLFVESDENEELNVLFVGLDEVTITARHPVERSFKDVAPLMPAIAQEELDRAATLALGG